MQVGNVKPLSATRTENVTVIAWDRRGVLSLGPYKRWNLESNGDNEMQEGSVKPLSGTRTEKVTVLTCDRREELSLCLN